MIYYCIIQILLTEYLGCVKEEYISNTRGWIMILICRVHIVSTRKLQYVYLLHTIGILLIYSIVYCV